MPEHTPIEIKFPLGGVHRGLALADQPPTTAVDAVNVRPEGNISRRARGGSRPGLRKAFFDALGALSLGTTVSVIESSGQTTWTATTVTDTVTTESQADGRSKITVAATGPFTGVAGAATVGNTVEFDTAGTQFVIDEIVDTENAWVIGDVSVAFAAGAAITIGPFRAALIRQSVRDDDTDSEYVIVDYTSVGVVVVRGDASGEAGAFHVGGSTVRMLASVNRAIDTGAEPQSFHEPFDTILSESWETAAHAANDGRPLVIHGGIIPGELITGEFGVVYEALASPNVDLTKEMHVEIRVTPRFLTEGSNQTCLCHVFLGLNDTSPDYTQDGYRISFEAHDVVELWRLRIEQYIGGVNSGDDPATTALADLNNYPDWPPVVFRVRLKEDGKTIEVFANGALVLVHAYAATLGAVSGSRFGVSTESNSGSTFTFVRVDDFIFRYTPYQPIQGTTRNQLVAIAAGKLHRNLTDSTMTELSSTIRAVEDRPILAAEHLQKLYIADWGDTVASATDGLLTTDPSRILKSATYPDWTVLGLNTSDYMCELTNVADSAVAGIYPINDIGQGGDAAKLQLGNRQGGAVNPLPSGSGSATFRITRGVKIYDSTLGTPFYLADETAGLGFPIGCSLIAMFQDRIFLAGDPDNPQVWYASKRGVPTDWLFLDESGDPSAATYHNIGDTGGIGDDITALAPISRDYMIFGGRSSIVAMRGDPSPGGSFDFVSRNIGIIDRSAWCVTPEGGLIFLSAVGLYYLSPGYDAQPVPISEGVLPVEFSNIDPTATEVTMEFDTHFGGVHIYLSPKTLSNYYPDAIPVRRHYWLSWRHRSLWPVLVASERQPFSLHSYATSNSGLRRVIHGGADGYLRTYEERWHTDDSDLIASHIILGPFDIRNGQFESIIASLNAELSESSDDVTWELYVADTPSLAATAALTGTTPSATGTWTTTGRNYESYPRRAGGGMCIKIKTLATGSGFLGSWAIETIDVGAAPGGRQRR